MVEVSHVGEQQLRDALRHRLHLAHASEPRTMVIEELGLRHGMARIDLVVVNSSLHGFEIKSSRDRLTRLPIQARVFSEVLDQVTLVVAEKHLMPACRIIPNWWGVISARYHPSNPVFIEMRRARQNPAPDQIALAKLLWRDEALAFLRVLGYEEGLVTKPRAAIYARLASITTRQQLRTQVRDCFLKRPHWRADARQTLDGD